MFLLNFLFLFIPILLSTRAVAQKEPYSTETRFENPPAKIYYFENTKYVLWHDRLKGLIHSSNDEGKTFFPVTTIPEGDAVMLVEHPFDNSYAYVLSSKRKHYRTKDHGQTWQSFEMDLNANLQDTPLSFHVDPQYNEWVIYHGQKCENKIFLTICSDKMYYTTNAFSTPSEPLIADAVKCLFAHSSKEFKHDAHQNLIFCIQFDSGIYDASHARLVSSTDFFAKDKNIVDFGIGERNARGVMAIAVVAKFAVVAVKDMNKADNELLEMFVTQDAKTWARAHFPHASSAGLREKAYTLLTGTTHSLAVDVLLRQHASIGTLFVSNSNGTFFTESLSNTNRDRDGFVDFEAVYGVEGVGLANVVMNADSVDKSGGGKIVESRMTFDDGRTWGTLAPPEKDSKGGDLCPGGGSGCFLHLHSVTTPHNYGRIFSSPAPGYVFGVGTAGSQLGMWDDSRTFFSDSAGLNWTTVYDGPTVYEFGGKGSVLVIVPNDKLVQGVSYSLNAGKTWKEYSWPSQLRINPKGLLTHPDSTSLKFLLVGSVRREDAKGSGQYVAVFLDFADVLRTCDEGTNSKDFEKWYARSRTGSECVMGHKQYYLRRKADADCLVGHKFEDPTPMEDNCQCTHEDYECDYNFVLQDDKCVAAGPLPVEAGNCEKGEPDEKFLGSSGYRKIPGNTCEGGLTKDRKIWRECKQAQPVEGSITHAFYDFPAAVVQNEFFPNSQTMLVRLADNSIYQSSNEGFTWVKLHEGHKFFAFYISPYWPDRAYLVTDTEKVFYTINHGQSWDSFKAPSRTNIFGLAAFSFHPMESNYLIWTGTKGSCSGGGDCHAEAQYSTNNGGSWRHVEDYVQLCQWGRSKELKIDSKQIVCEAFKDKKGDQRFFRDGQNPVQLGIGSPFYKNPKIIFNNVVGFAKFSEYLLVAEYLPEKNTLDLQVSLDGKQFSTGLFPPDLRINNHAYTILESSTDSVFLHLTTSDLLDAKWGNLLKSNSNGTYYSTSVDHVSRNNAGYVDFEKMIGLDGIALINVVGNPNEAVTTRRKALKTKITHNDGGTWKMLNPPGVDSLGQSYKCSTTSCALHIHGFTERYDARATFSSPAIPGILMGVGNVGEELAPYTESDTFLSRDGGFVWEEIHKDAHLWEFGDSGSILVLANDEEATDKVSYSTDEGKTWRDYTFGRSLRIRSITNLPSDTSRKFVMFGHMPTSNNAFTAVHLDFSALTSKKCVLDPNHPNDDDFELWSPAEERTEKCLFGRQTEYHRRIRDAQCFVGDTELLKANVVTNCTCTEVDFECEYNHVRDPSGNCVLVFGAKALPVDTSWETCNGDKTMWYERTNFRKIPHSSCEGGLTKDRGPAHPCPGLSAHGFWFWVFMGFIALALTALFSLWWRRSGFSTGAIRLPDRAGPPQFEDSGPLATLASIPWFIIGVAGAVWSKIGPRLPFFKKKRTGGGYRTVAVDEDAQVLRFEDED